MQEHLRWDRSTVGIQEQHTSPQGVIVQDVMIQDLVCASRSSTQNRRR